jgi:hydrogenase-4 membrane subunit HyfE
MYTGLSLAITSSIFFTFIHFNGESDNRNFVILMAVLSLFYMMSSILYSISFFVTKRAKKHTWIRIYSITNLLAFALAIMTGFYSQIGAFFIPGIVAILEAIFIYLHFVYERDNNVSIKESDEILDIG